MNNSKLLKKSEHDLVEHIVTKGLYDIVYKDEAKKAFHIRDTYLESAKAPIGINYFSLLPSIRKPVLLIGSTHDKVTPSVNIYYHESTYKAGTISYIEKYWSFK